MIMYQVSLLYNKGYVYLLNLTFFTQFRENVFVDEENTGLEHIRSLSDHEITDLILLKVSVFNNIMIIKIGYSRVLEVEGISEDAGKLGC